ncbi:ribonuclease 3 [Bryobacterales bacterium F-183]|nr:ribonuclease 3 [Bryobacterales bacterium F-183]
MLPTGSSTTGSTVSIDELESDIGYRFRNRELLLRALTHRSRIYEKNPPGTGQNDNEQLEFLGDSILGFVISEYLIRRFPGHPEGRLSKLKAHLVSATRLYEVAQSLNLGDYLILGRGEEMSGGREKRALLADAIEAIIAAIYLDSGMDDARRFIEDQVPGPELFEDGEITTSDHKSALQELAQALKLPQPKYTILSEEGPEHAKMFTVEVRVGKDWVSKAQGNSKKSAGQKAAQLVLNQLSDWGR